MTDVASSLDIDDLRRRVDALKTHFNAPFDFGHGIVTRSARVQRRFARRLRLLQIPADLTGKTFVITGTLSRYGRDQIEDLIKQAGGKASGSVSKKTDYLVAGEKAGSKLDKERDDG